MINNVIYCILNWVIIAVSIVVCMRFYREEEIWRGKAAKILMLCIWVVVISIEAWDSQHEFIPYIQVIVYGIWNAVIIKLFYRCEYSTVLTWLWFYNTIIMMIKTPMLVMHEVSEQKGSFYANIGNGRRTDEIILVFLITCVAGGIWIRYRRQTDDLLKTLTNLKKKRYFCLLIEIIYMCVLHRILGIGISRYDEKGLWITLLLVTGMFLSILLLLFYTMYFQIKWEKQSLMKQQQLMRKENEVIRGYCEQDAKRLHDLKHTFLYMQECLESKKYDALKECVEEHLGYVKEQQKQVWTGIEEVDFILNYKYQEMRKWKIQFTLDIEVYKIIALAGENLMIVLGNLLDNAIEAAQKCPQEKREIHLMIRNVNEMFLLQVKNSCVEKPMEENGGFRTFKEDEVYHGWGLKNVKQIIEEAGGDFQCEWKDNRFITRILLYEKGGM